MFRERLTDRFCYVTYEAAYVKLSPWRKCIELLVERCFLKLLVLLEKESLKEQPDLQGLDEVYKQLKKVFCWCRPGDLTLETRYEKLVAQMEGASKLPEDFVRQVETLHTLVQADFRRQRLNFQAQRERERLQHELRNLQIQKSGLEPRQEDQYVQRLQVVVASLQAVTDQLGQAILQEKRIKSEQSIIYEQLKQKMCG